MASLQENHNAWPLRHVNPSNLDAILDSRDWLSRAAERIRGAYRQQPTGFPLLALNRAIMIGLIASSLGACAHAAALSPEQKLQMAATADQAANALADAPAPTVVSSTTGGASWYGPGFNGKKAASSETFNENAQTAAHRSLPFGTWVRVTNLANNLATLVRINDRGPFHGKRIIDLSKKAATDIDMINSGTANVLLEVLSHAPVTALAYQ